ncbi:MAG: hypothetical protein PUC59_10345 [Firmicutes bacterium]|nr:hypothetical protein [Bacillota bacterium]
MFKVIYVFKVGKMISVTLEGNGVGIKNGSELMNEHGNLFKVVSVGMPRHDNPSDISKSTDVLLTPCNLQKGDELYIA